MPGKPLSDAEKKALAKKKKQPKKGSIEDTKNKIKARKKMLQDI